MLSIFLTLLTVINGQGCLKANNINGLPPPFMDYSCLDNSDDDDCRRSDTIPELHQAIIPSYRFTCCGNITEWGVDVHPADVSRQMAYTLDLQVWRPSPTTGCYSLVGNNRFPSVSLTDQLVMVTPLPQEWIEFKSNDILGFSLENTKGDDGGVVLLMDSSSKQGDHGYETEEVWYADISNTVPDNGVHPFPASRVLSTSIRAAPVISVSYSTTSCPTKVQSETSALRHQLTKLCIKSSAPVLTTRTSLHSSVKTSQWFSPIPTIETPQTTTSNPNMNMRSDGVLAGVIIAGLAVIFLSTMIAFLVMWRSMKVKKNHSNNEVPMVDNEAYANRLQLNVGTHGDNAYDYPKIMASHTISIDTEQNEAYATTTEIVANATTITMYRNDAYSGSELQDIGTKSGVYEYVF